jgi:hypothetical protein
VVSKTQRTGHQDVARESVVNDLSAVNLINPTATEDNKNNCQVPTRALTADVGFALV